MEVLEWVVSKILNINIKKVKGKVVVKNAKTPEQYIGEDPKNVDLLVEFRKKQILIELNDNYHGNYLRNLLYTFEVLINKYKVDNLSDFEEIILVNLSWYNDEALYNSIERKTILEYSLDGNYPSEKLMKIYNVNLLKYEEDSYNNVKSEDKFYKILTIKDKKELEKVRKNEQALKNYVNKLSYLSENVLFREDYMSIEVSNYINDCAREEAKNDAYESGLKEGNQEAKCEMIRKLNQMGLSHEDIAEASSFPISKVEEIIEKNSNS